MGTIRMAISEPKQLEKNFQLTAAEFEQLLLRLQQGDERLFESVFLAQFEPAINYLKKRFKADHEIAYDTVMSTMTNFFLRIKDGKVRYGNLRYLFIQMLVQEYYRRCKKVWRFEEFDGIDLANPDNDQQELMALFDQAFAQLDPNCRALLYAYYYEDQSYSELAKKFGKTQVAIRKRKQRCQQRFKSIFKALLQQNAL